MHVVRTQSGITFKCPNTKDQHFSFEESDKMNPYDELTDDFIQSELCPHLGQFKRLKTIVLRGRKFTDVGGRAIAEALKGNTSVTSVDFSDIEHKFISVAVRREIIEVLLENHGVDNGIIFKDECKFYDFETCEEFRPNAIRTLITDASIQPLCANLGRFKRLKTIKLDPNNLTAVGGCAIAEGLKGNNSVICVDLDQDKRKIPIGTSEIAEGLLQRHGVDNGIVIECGESCRFYCFETCEEIDLHQRRVTDDGIQPLCANLGRFKRLKKINLHSNSIRDAGAIAILDGLKVNSSVTWLELANNPLITKAGAIAIRDCLKVKSNLTYLSLGSEIEHDIRTILQSNMVKDDGVFVCAIDLTADAFFDFETCEKIVVTRPTAMYLLMPLLANLGRFKRLWKMHLEVEENGDYSDAAMTATKHAIKEGLKANCRVTEVLINSSSWKWGDAFRAFNKELPSIIRPNRDIHGVFFMDCFYDFEHTESIVESNRKEVHDTNIQPLCSNLGQFKRLSKIRLTQDSSCSIGVRGVRGLLDGLKANSTVTEFSLGYVPSCNTDHYKKEDLETDSSGKVRFVPAIVKRNKDEPELRRAEVASIRAKYDLLMCSAPAADLDCSGLFVAQWLMDAVAHAAEHSATVATINMSNNCLTPQIAAKLQQHLSRFSSLKLLNISGNCFLGPVQNRYENNDGISPIVSSLPDGVTHIDVSGCFLGVRDSDSTSHYGNDWFLPTAIIKRLPYLQQLCCFSEGGADAVAPQLQLPPTKTFRDGIESMKNFFYGHETQNLAFIGEKTTQCFEDYFKKPIIQKVCIILDIISALWEHRQTDSSTMEQPPQQSPLQLLSPPAPAQQMFISIVSHKLSDSLAPAVGKFLDKHYARVSEIMNWKDHSGRTAGATALLLCKNAMLSRVLFMGLYDIPDGLQHEYKSATCTVYLAHHVEGEKRTTVALKFMKNADEFEREKSSREILLAPRSGQEQTFQDYIVESTDSYHHKVAVFHSAVQKRKWLVDYSNPCLLVMPAADRNLRIIMDNERITKPEAIKSMSHRIMICAKFMHDRGFIHGDLKPRNIMRILHRLMLVDFDASAQVGRQYSWSKHSSAYMPPEAICVFMSLRSDEFSVVDASSAAQCTVAFNVLLPIAIPAGTLFTISIAPVRVAAVHKFTLDAGDWSSCISVKDRVITVTAKDALDAGKHGFNVAGVFEDSLPAAEFMRAELEHIVNTLHPIEGTRKDDLAKCTLTIRNPMKDAEIMSNESRQRLVSSVVSSLPHVPTPGDIGPDVPCECTCSKILPLNMRDASIPAACIGLCGVAHSSHDMWALGVLLFRFCARESLWSENDEDNIKADSGHLLDLAIWTGALKKQRLQNIDDTATRELVSKLLEKQPWKRPSIDEVLAMPFNEMDVIKLKLQQTVPSDASQSSNLVGSVKDLRTGKFSDAAYGLRPYLKVADDWKEDAACTLQGMQDEVDLLKDCPDCAQVQADVLQQLGRGEAAATQKLASALAELKEQRKKGAKLAAADVVKALRSDISALEGWYYGLPNSISWPTDKLKSGYRTFSQPMCKGCQNYCLDHSSIFADLHYIMHEPAVEKEEWNGIRDHGRAGRRLKDFMTLPQATEALLTEVELAALRFYTSHSFNALNIAMRDSGRQGPHPLPGIMMNMQRGLKKLRALGSDDASSKQTVVLWRGMSYMNLTQQFNAEGGTELAPMSTTNDVSVAISYAVKKDTRSALLFRFVTRNNLERGADVQWLSMFPGESETLFPPLTFLQRTRTEPQQVEHNGVTVTIVELSTTLA